MFIKRPTLRKMMNAAYKTYGLYIENDGKGFRIKGAYWDLWVLRGKLPKEYKADIVGLIGDLPEIGNGGLYTKEGIQQEIPGFPCSREMAEQGGRIYKDTGVIVISPRGEALRLIQAPETCETMMIYNYILEGVSNAIVDSENAETQAEGIYNPSDNMMVLKNNVMTFMTFARNEPCLYKFKNLMENYYVPSLLNPEIEDVPEKEEDEEEEGA